MKLFSKEILAIARKNRTLVPAAVVNPTSAKLVSEVDVRQALQEIPSRENFLLMLALLATSKGHLKTTDLEKLADEEFSSQLQPSPAQATFFAELLRLHGHSTTVTIAAIHFASRSPHFDKSTFRAAREKDPQFWSLLWNFGRPRMPASVFAPYALYEAERRMGAPITDLSKISAYLIPGEWQSEASS